MRATIIWVMIVRAWLYSKKGDLEFIEVIMVLVVVVVLLVIGLAIYYAVSIKGVEETAGKLSEVEATVLINIIDYMPEVQCSMRAAPKDCVDAVKLQAFKSIVEENKNVYIDRLGFKVVRFERIYPVPEKSKLRLANGECDNNAYYDPFFFFFFGNWTVYSHPKPGYKFKDIVKTPVSLFFPTNKAYYVGVLYVEVYR